MWYETIQKWLTRHLLSYIDNENSNVLDRNKNIAVFGVRNRRKGYGRFAFFSIVPIVTTIIIFAIL